jgi:hypothetical protein
VAHRLPNTFSCMALQRCCAAAVNVITATNMGFLVGKLVKVGALMACSIFEGMLCYTTHAWNLQSAVLSPQTCWLYGVPLKVTAHLIHGYGLIVYICDEDISVGSSWSCQCMLMSLEQVRQWDAQRSRKMPQHLHIQADNTSREFKNSISLKVKPDVRNVRPEHPINRFPKF